MTKHTRRILGFWLFAFFAFGCLHTPSRAFADGPARPEARYVGIAQQNLAIRSEMSTEAETVGTYKRDERVYIVSYEPNWLYVVQGNDETWVTGYVQRHIVWDIVACVEDVLPYGATPAAYNAVIGDYTMLYQSPDENSEPLWTLTKGMKIAILEIENGWAKVICWRQYGYFHVSAIDTLIPVYDLQTAQSGDYIAAFVSFYNLSETGLNPNRMLNIAKACEYISIPMAPGDEFSFNGTAGPYQSDRGYLMAMSYFEGETVPSGGGGTCQVSSTLYNTLLPLSGGINILHRRAHGPSGAVYLPHGVDAAVGNATLDLVFRNDYPFTVRIEASAQDGVLFIAMLKV